MKKSLWVVMVLGLVLVTDRIAAMERTKEEVKDEQREQAEPNKADAPSILSPYNPEAVQSRTTLITYGAVAGGALLALATTIWGIKRGLQHLKDKKQEELISKNPFGLMAVCEAEEPVYFRDYQQILRDPILDTQLFEKWNGYFRTPFELIADEDFGKLVFDQREEVLVIAKIFQQKYLHHEIVRILPLKKALAQLVEQRGLQDFLNQEDLPRLLTPDEITALTLLHKKDLGYQLIYESAVKANSAFSGERLDEMRVLYEQHNDFRVVHKHAKIKMKIGEEKQ